MTLFDSMKKGTVELLVLSLLSESDMYGYQMVREILTRTDGKYVLKEGALYPVLYKLTDANMVTCYTIHHGRRPRIYYHLEPSGLEHGKQIYNEYLDLTKAVRTITEGKFE
ncbi:MAG: PadR family transcriptional regulator [Clostridia bacterium]|nr:PadR family transcriptional regulator [Clostridia bacterium]